MWTQGKEVCLFPFTGIPLFPIESIYQLYPLYGTSQ